MLDIKDRVYVGDLVTAKPIRPAYTVAPTDDSEQSTGNSLTMNYSAFTCVVFDNKPSLTIIIVNIIIVWFVLNCLLPFPRATSMQKAHPWKTRQLRFLQ